MNVGITSAEYDERNYEVAAGNFFSATIREAFENDGFAPIPRFASLSDVGVVDTILRNLLKNGVGFNEGARRDLLDPDDTLNSKCLTELIEPHNYAPALHKTRYFAHALALAKSILGPEATFAFDHAILKPVWQGAQTPWHQDEAYQSLAARGRYQLAIWMPTGAATVENGCMRYISGSHKRGVMTHRPFGGDERVHGLECTGPFDPTQATYCPLDAGDVVIHEGRTLHGAGPNLTGIERLAYICVFSAPGKPVGDVAEFEWLHRPAEAASLRRQRWLRKGGALIEFVRRARRAVAAY